MWTRARFPGNLFGISDVAHVLGLLTTAVVRILDGPLGCTSRQVAQISSVCFLHVSVKRLNRIAVAWVRHWHLIILLSFRPAP